MRKKQGFNWEDGLVFLAIAISLFATFYIISHLPGKAMAGGTESGFRVEAF